MEKGKTHRTSRTPCALDYRRCAMNNATTRLEKRQTEMVMEVQANIIDTLDCIRRCYSNIQKDFELLREVQLLLQGEELLEPTLF